MPIPIDALPLMPGTEPVQVIAPVNMTAPQFQAQHRCDCPVCRPAARTTQEVCEEVSRAVFSWDEPPAPPPPVNPWPGRIPGVYDFSLTEPGSSLNGAVRYRVPGTLDVTDEQGRIQWTFETEHADGSLSTASGRRWVPI